VSVKFSFRDKDGIEVCAELENDVTIAPHKKETVTSTRMMKNEEWKQVDSYHVSTERP